MKREWKRLFHGETAFVWAVLLVVAIPFFPEYIAPFLAIGAAVAAGLDAKKRQTTLRIGSVGKSVLLYMVYVLIGITYSAHPMNSISTFAMWGSMFCVYVTLVTVLNSRRRMHTFVFCLGAVSALIAAVACVQYVALDIVGTDFPNQLWLPLDKWFYSVFPLEVDLYRAAHRACGTFINPNILGEYLAMTIPIVGYYAFTELRTKRTLLARGFVFLMVLGLVASFSRGAYIALLAIALMMIVSNVKRITPLMLCLVAATALIPEAIAGRFLSIGQIGNDIAIFERFSAWDVALQTIVSHPVFGLGPGVSNFWELLKNAGANAMHSHNLVLQLLIEGGFIGLFLMCAVAIRLLQNNLELTNRRGHGSGFGNAIVMFVVVFIVYGMVDYPFLSPKLMGAFFIVLGIGDANATVYLRRQTTSLVEIPRVLLQRVTAYAARFPLLKNLGKTRN